MDAFSRRLRGIAAAARIDDWDEKLAMQIEQRPRRTFRAQSRMVAEGRPAGPAQVIVSGWACRLAELDDGRKQVIELLTAGDMLSVQTWERALEMTSVAALTQVRTAEAGELREALQGGAPRPGLAAVLELALGEAQLLLTRSILRLGRMTAHERMANLLAELEWRLAMRGLAEDGAFDLPLTQEMLADTLGLSVVHVNRTLQQMRREGLIEYAGGMMRLVDVDAVARAGAFRPPVMVG